MKFIIWRSKINPMNKRDDINDRLKSSVPPNGSQLETLKYILENALQPQCLDSHPWAGSLIVLESKADAADFQECGPGQQLVNAIARLFVLMMPSTPPKHGKRLDTRWGEFGILAAQYFAPLTFGTPTPATLHDAWGRIDHSILLFINGRSDDALTDVEKEAYQLVGAELEATPTSTLSDWHRKGLQRLLDLILAREDYLAKRISNPIQVPADGQSIAGADEPSVLPETKDQHGKVQRSGMRRFLSPLPILLLVVFLLILFGSLKAWKIYKMAVVVRQDAAQIQELIKDPALDLELVKRAGPALFTLRQDFQILKNETEPFFWLGAWLKWMPVYGGDLASMNDLMIMTDALLASADISAQVVLPLMEESTAAEDQFSLRLPRLLKQLHQAEPQFAEARASLDVAMDARGRLAVASLSPRVSDLILNQVDRLIPLLQDGMTLAMEIPRLMGATEDGPKTYLLLVQNEDELRPTGGFITAAGTLVLKDGQVLSIDFTDSGELDNWDRPYPLAPWQLDRYMNSRVLILRDSNWFTDFPTSALYAENLYAYHNSHSVDGVIAFDQHMLVLLLRALGPIEVEGAPYLINSNNIISFMRISKTPPPGRPVPPDWNRKSFMGKVANSILDKIFSGDEIPWKQLGEAGLQGLNERHLLLQLDDPLLKEVISQHSWDGAVKPGAGDFLMVVDANIGFNKTSAVVETQLIYDVDLTDPQIPTSQLTVIHENNSSKDVDCIQWDTERNKTVYPIDACYYNYMRVYTQAGTKVLDSVTQTVPNAWMILNRGVKAHVDVLDEEIKGLQTFGTLMVVPGGESLNTTMQFGLPRSILEDIPDLDQKVYHLTVQKQPGTIAIPIIIRVHLPVLSRLVSNSPVAVKQGDNLLFETDLQTDIEITVLFGK